MSIKSKECLQIVMNGFDCHRFERDLQYNVVLLRLQVTLQWSNSETPHSVDLRRTSRCWRVGEFYRATVGWLGRNWCILRRRWGMRGSDLVECVFFVLLFHII